MKKTIAERIWCAVPVNQPAFLKLLELLEIRETRQIPTAAVTSGFRSRLLINPDFVARHCTTDDRLAMLVLHELNHVLLGHTRLHPIADPVQNWAFDAIINAGLCQMYPADTHTALFRSFYCADTFPEALLRPPVGWPDRVVQWRLRGEASRVHRALYTEASATFDEVMAVLERALATYAGRLDIRRLLGSHDEDGRQLPAIAPDLVREARQIDVRWPRTQGGVNGDSELLRKEVAQAQARKQVVRTIRDAIQDIAPKHGKTVWSRMRPDMEANSVLPYRTGVDRRAAVYAQLGIQPLSFRAASSVRIPDYRGDVHVYLDVSQSMDDLLPIMYAALRPLLPVIHDKVHLFSTAVRDVPPAAIRNGLVETTEATSLDCVVRHIVDHRVRRAVVITDGDGQYPAEEDLAKLRSLGARVNKIVTADAWTESLEGIPGRVFALPELSQF